MKKILVLIMVILSITIVKYQCNADVPHQCPPGYNSNIITLTINGCDYGVWICYNCDYGVSTADTSKVVLGNFWKIDFECTQTWSTQQIKDAIIEHISNASFLFSLCQQEGFPPCSEPPAEPVGIKFQVSSSICWYKHTKLDGNIEYIPCPSSDCCYYSYYICIDPVDGNQVIVIYDGPHRTYEGIPCLAPEPPDPQIGEFTPCFHLPTQCD